MCRWRYIGLWSSGYQSISASGNEKRTLVNDYGDTYTSKINEAFRIQVSFVSFMVYELSKINFVSSVKHMINLQILSPLKVITRFRLYWSAVFHVLIVWVVQVVEARVIWYLLQTGTVTCFVTFYCTFTLFVNIWAIGLYGELIKY